MVRCPSASPRELRCSITSSVSGPLCLVLRQRLGEFIAALDRLRKIDDHFARGFEHAINTQAVSKPTGRVRASPKKKACGSGSTVAELAVIEDRLRDVED